MLDRPVRARLRTLSKSNADHVASHLVMAGRLVDVDPELAYQHARTAVGSAGRVDVVREALALTAYATGRYAEALREVRTVRRLSGVDAHPAIEADCERGLGRPERALAVISEAKKRELPVAEAVELTLVESGARADLGQHDAALLVLDKLLPAVRDAEPRQRLLLVRADRLETLGRHEEAEAARSTAGGLAAPESVVVTDLLGDDADEQGEHASAGARAVPAADSQPESSDGRELDVDPELSAGDGSDEEAEPEHGGEPQRAPESEPEHVVAPERAPAPTTASAPMTEPEPEPEVESQGDAEPGPEPLGEPEPEQAPEEDAEPEHAQLDLFADTDLEDRQ